MHVPEPREGEKPGRIDDPGAGADFHLGPRGRDARSVDRDVHAFDESPGLYVDNGYTSEHERCLRRCTAARKRETEPEPDRQSAPQDGEDPRLHAGLE